MTNLSELPVTVARIRTSCDCLVVDFPYEVVAPHEKLNGELLLDLASERDWKGNLGIEVDALTSADEVAFRLVVNAEIRSPSSAEARAPNRDLDRVEVNQ